MSASLAQDPGRRFLSSQPTSSALDEGAKVGRHFPMRKSKILTWKSLFLIWKSKIPTRKWLPCMVYIFSSARVSNWFMI